jgi:DNA mismatch repair protein MSH5
VRPPAEFDYEAAENKLFNLRLDANHASQVNFVVPGDVVLDDSASGFESLSGQQGKLLHLAGLIDRDSRLTVQFVSSSVNPEKANDHQIGCAGALLSYLQRRRAAGYLPGDPDAHMMFRVSSLEMFSLRDIM